MRIPRDLNAVLAAVCLASAVVGTVRWRAAPLALPETGVENPRLSPRPTGPPSAPTDESEEPRADPFRFSREMPSVRFGDEPRPEPSQGPRYRPSLALKGVMGGPPWTAVVAGIPGSRGARLLTERERIDSLTVLSIGADSLVIAGPDTVWILRLERGRP